MDSKTREKILHRCEILTYMGDDGIPCIYDQLPDDELMEDCGWVLDKAHDDLDNYCLLYTSDAADDSLLLKAEYNPSLQNYLISHERSTN